MNDPTRLLEAAVAGDRQASAVLLPLLYDELRRLAASKLAREAPGQTLQATALVHEAWLRLAGGRGQERAWNDRTHFVAVAAEVMRHILTDNARRKKAVRHGGGLERAGIDDSLLQIAAPEGDDDELLAVHEALDQLAAHDPRKAELVKLRYFVGMSIEETAQILGISMTTAKRDWTYARAWLFREISRAKP
ncbi:MAG: sigma-70 family RNA polymerase sigma factor [Opitutaceae bacterium]|nr:sigma-70 family RNA polymerase sigma factor [Opitutaceae bacterium]